MKRFPGNTVSREVFAGAGYLRAQGQLEGLHRQFPPLLGIVLGLCLVMMASGLLSRLNAQGSWDCWSGHRRIGRQVCGLPVLVYDINRASLGSQPPSLQ